MDSSVRRSYVRNESESNTFGDAVRNIQGR